MFKDYNEDGSYRYTNVNDATSYNAPIVIINTVRNTGKTTGAKIRAYKRYKRKGVGTIWARRIENDTIRARQTFFNKKFFRFTKTDPEDFRVNGNYAETRIKGKWHRFIEFVTISQKTSERSADDDFYDTIIYDEGNVTQAKRNMYHGNEVEDLFDLYDSKRRDGKMTLIIFGNRETVNNIYLTYLGIPTPPFDFNGIKSFKGGSVVFMQRTTPPPDANDFDDKVHKALEGTRYGNFKYKGTAKEYDDVHIGKKPKNAHHYCAFEKDGLSVTAWYANGQVYFTAGRDKNRLVVVFTTGEYKEALLYTSRDRPRFSALMTAKRRNEIYYENAAVAETATEILKTMGI